MERKIQPHQPLKQIPSLSTSKLKQTNTSLMIVLVLVSLLMAGGFVYFAYQNYLLQRKIQKLSQTTNFPEKTTLLLTPYPSPDLEFAKDWETYIGSEFSLKYPKEVKLVNLGETVRFQYIGPGQSQRPISSLFDGYQFNVTQLGNVSQKTPLQWATERWDNSKVNCGPNVIQSEISKVTLSLGEGFQYTLKGCFGTDHTLTYTSHKDKVYEITQTYAGEEEDKKVYEETTNQIIKTFKFI